MVAWVRNVTEAPLDGRFDPPPPQPAFMGAGDHLPNAAMRNEQLDSVLNKLADLSGCEGVEADDISDLIKELEKLDDPLQKFQIVAVWDRISDEHKRRMADEWVDIFNMTDVVAKEVVGNCGDHKPLAPSLVVWAKMCLKMAQCRVEKLYVLMESSWKYPTDVYSSNDIEEMSKSGWEKAQVKYRTALESVEERWAEYHPTPYLLIPDDDSVKKPQVIYKETGVDVDWDLEESKLSDVRQQLSQYQLALQTANKEIDTLKLAQILALQEAADFQVAEKICNDLITLREEQAILDSDVTDKVAILELKYKLAELQIKQQNFADAADTARAVWENRKIHIGEDSNPARSSLLQFCKALRGQNYFQEADARHREIWQSSKGECDELWRIRNGFELALVLAEQKHWDEAFDVHNAALEAAKDMTEINADESSEMLDSRYELGKMLYDEKLLEKAKLVLDEVWRARTSRFPVKQNESIAAAESLVDSLKSLGRWEYAETVSRWICDGGLQDCAPDDPRFLASLESLGEVLMETEKFEEAASKFKKVWESREKRSGSDHEQTLAVGQLYSRALYHQALSSGALFKDPKYAEAAEIIKDIWEKRQSVSGEGDRKLTLECGHFYGVVLLKQKQIQEAEKILSEVWEERHGKLGIYDDDTLESCLAYAKALLEQDDKDQFLRAESILSETWTPSKEFLKGKPGTAYDKVLEIGNSLCRCLRKLKKYQDSLIVMEDVYARKLAQLDVNDLPPTHPFSVSLVKISGKVKRRHQNSYLFRGDTSSLRTMATKGSGSTGSSAGQKGGHKTAKNRAR